MIANGARYLPVLILLLGFALGQGRIGLEVEGVHALFWHPDGRLFLGHHQGIAVSSDRGRRWSDLLRQPEAEVLTFAYDGNRIIAAGHGTYAIISPRGNVRLKALEGLPSEKIDAYAIDPLRPWQHYAWLRGQGLFFSQDAGYRWTRLETGDLPLPDPREKRMAHALAVDRKGQILIGGMGFGIWWRPDAGSGFVPLSTPVAEVTALAIDALGRLWMGSKSGVWLRTDGRWRRLAQGVVIALAVQPSSPPKAAWIDASWWLHFFAER